MNASFDRQYWDDHWQGSAGGAMAAGPPNPHLVREVADLDPGAALDVGCGAGAEVIWLAGQGWQVTGIDIATEALASAVSRVPPHVADRIDWVRGDAWTWVPERQFDLVTTHYAHPTMPQVEFYDRLADWVSPGGTLLIVGHLHHQAAPDSAGAPGHGHGHEHGRGHGGSDVPGPPPEATVGADEVRSRFDPTRWEVATAEEVRRVVTRPDGGEHVLDDVVVRVARRA